MLRISYYIGKVMGSQTQTFNKIDELLHSLPIGFEMESHII